MAETNSNSSLNKVLTGLILGVLVPAIAVLIFYFWNFSRVPFSFFVKHTLQLHVLPQIISLCVIPNLGLFFLFIWLNHLYSARGVLFATFIITIAVIILKAFIGFE